MTSTMLRKSQRCSETKAIDPIGDRGRAIEPVATPQTPMAPPAGITAFKDITPLLVALTPFSIAIGAAAQTNGLSGVEAMAGAFMLMAGASQLAAIELIGAGTGWVVIVLTASAINLRFMLYSTRMAQWFEHVPLKKKMALAFTLVDQNYMISENRFGAGGESDPAWRTRYYGTASISLVVVFISCQVIGYRLGATLPEQLGLHMAVPLAFAGLLAKTAAGGEARVAASVAAVVALIAVGLPAGTALPVAAIAGVAIGSSRTIRTVTKPKYFAQVTNNLRKRKGQS